MNAFAVANLPRWAVWLLLALLFLVLPAVSHLLGPCDLKSFTKAVNWTLRTLQPDGAAA